MNKIIELKPLIDSLLEGYSVNELKLIRSKLSDNYLANNNQGIDIIKDELSAKIYASSRMPATYQACLNVYNHVKENFIDNISTYLDVGAGTGASAIAAVEAFSIDEINCYEKNPYMMELGKYLVDNLNINNNWKKFDIETDEINTEFDLITISYLLNEIKIDYRIKVINKLWMATNKLLIIIEPGTPQGYQNIMGIKDYLLNNGAYIVAPCPNKNCPLDKNKDWCNFSVRVERSKMHKLLKEASSPFEDEKYFYMAFSKSNNKPKENRIIRHPIISSNNIKLTVCSLDKIEELTIYKKDKELFKKLKKKKVGDSY